MHAVKLTESKRLIFKKSMTSMETDIQAMSKMPYERFTYAQIRLCLFHVLLAKTWIGQQNQLNHSMHPLFIFTKDKHKVYLLEARFITVGFSLEKILIHE